MEVSDGLLTGKRLKNLTSCALAFKLFSVRTAGNALCLRMWKYSFLSASPSIQIARMSIVVRNFLAVANSKSARTSTFVRLCDV